VSIDQYKDKNRAELWQIVQIQAQVTDSMQLEANRLETKIAELEKELVKTKEIISVLTIADETGYIDGVGFVAEHGDLCDQGRNILEANNLDQQAKGVEDAALDLAETTLVGIVIKDGLGEKAEILRNQAKALKEQGNG
jgi:hypothetical protein